MQSRKSKRTRNERLVPLTVYMEEEALEALEELSKEFQKSTGKRWSKGAVIRVAVSEFFSKMGKML